MKHIFSILIVSIIASFSIYGAEKGAIITFDEKSHDFGTIKEADGPVSYSFKFENTGDEPLVIINVNASCGCTRPDYPKEPIRPGKKGEIKVTYNPAGRPGQDPVKAQQLPRIYDPERRPTGGVCRIHVTGGPDRVRKRRGQLRRVPPLV